MIFEKGRRNASRKARVCGHGGQVRGRLATIIWTFTLVKHTSRLCFCQLAHARGVEIERNIFSLYYLSNQKISHRKLSSRKVVFEQIMNSFEHETYTSPIVVDHERSSEVCGPTNNAYLAIRQAKIKSPLGHNADAQCGPSCDLSNKPVWPARSTPSIFALLQC